MSAPTVATCRTRCTGLVGNRAGLRAELAAPSATGVVRRVRPSTSRAFPVGMVATSFAHAFASSVVIGKQRSGRGNGQYGSGLLALGPRPTMPSGLVWRRRGVGLAHVLRVEEIWLAEGPLLKEGRPTKLHETI